MNPYLWMMMPVPVLLLILIAFCEKVKVNVDVPSVAIYGKLIYSSSISSSHSRQRFLYVATPAVHRPLAHIHTT